MPVRCHQARLTVTIAATAVAMPIVATFAVYNPRPPAQAGHSVPHRHGLPTTPGSYAPVKVFTTATAVKPNLVVYYGGWLEPFQVNFATTAAYDGAVPLVQMNPSGASVATIAASQYDSYPSSFASAVRAYHHPVILSFGHEINGHWYSWGYTHKSPVVFVAAWRHTVTLFRSLRVQIHDPIPIAETSATPVAGQPAKIADLFARIHLYGLLGFVWFDSVDKVDWRLSSAAAMTPFRSVAEAYQRPAL